MTLLKGLGLPGCGDLLRQYVARGLILTWLLPLPVWLHGSFGRCRMVLLVAIRGLPLRGRGFLQTRSFRFHRKSRQEKFVPMLAKSRRRCGGYTATGSPFVS